jgi:hypothetical protein
MLILEIQIILFASGRTTKIKSCQIIEKLEIFIKTGILLKPASDKYRLYLLITKQTPRKKNERTIMITQIIREIAIFWKRHRLKCKTMREENDLLYCTSLFYLFGTFF